jgi:hypothetical protein
MLRPLLGFSLNDRKLRYAYGHSGYKTEKDYNQALKRLEKTFHASSDSEEGDEAEVLVYFD